MLASDSNVRIIQERTERDILVYSLEEFQLTKIKESILMFKTYLCEAYYQLPI